VTAETLGAAPLANGFFQRFEQIEPGWRSFPRHYLLYASSGAFHLSVADAQWVLPPHRAAWIAADVLMEVRILAPVTCASVLFAPESLGPLGFACRVFGVTALAREMIAYTTRWGPERDPADAAADRFFLALAAVCLDLAQTPDRYWLPVAHSHELAGALAYTRERCHERLCIGDVARHVGVSERTLARRCATETHMSWREYLQRARMISALERLASPEHSIAEVAYATGFESLSAFTTAFRRFTGDTPAAYRKRIAPT
jgi:AraC-like DNA-binding protein